MGRKITDGIEENETGEVCELAGHVLGIGRDGDGTGDEVWNGFHDRHGRGSFVDSTIALY